MRRSSYALAIHQRRRRDRLRAGIVNGDVRTPFELAAMKDGLQLADQARRELGRHVEAMIRCDSAIHYGERQYAIQVVLPDYVRRLTSIHEIIKTVQKAVLMEVGSLDRP